MSELNDLLSVREVAIKLHYHPATIYELVKKNELEAYRIGEGRTIRIPAAAVTRLLAGNKQGVITA
jgi:excisionase family DNA binding protein